MLLDRSTSGDFVTDSGVTLALFFEVVWGTTAKKQSARAELAGQVF